MKSLIKKIISFTSLIPLIWGFAACSFTTSSSTEPSPKETVATPVFSVESGEVTSGTTVEITCSTEGAAIYYTTDGSVPTAEDSRYTGQITIEPPMTVKAIAIKKGMNNSAVAEATYTAIELQPKLTAPIASMGYNTEPSPEKIRYCSLLEPGYTSSLYVRNEIGSGTVITLSSTEDAAIYYTIDGSEPDTKSNVYTQPIEITKKCTLKAKTVKNGYRDSDLLSLNIENPYKRELISISQFSFNDLFIHGNALLGLFIIYEATEDLSGPDFSKQHFMIKMDDGNTVPGDGIGSDLILTFDTFDINNYDEALKLNTMTDFSTMDYIECNGTFKGRLWIKELFKCDDPELLEVPLYLIPIPLNLGYFQWKDSRSTQSPHAYSRIYKTVDIDEIAFLFIDATSKVPEDWMNKKITAIKNEKYDYEHTNYVEYMADISNEQTESPCISIMKLKDSSNYYILPTTEEKRSLYLTPNSVISDEYIRK